MKYSDDAHSARAVVESISNDVAERVVLEAAAIAARHGRSVPDLRGLEAGAQAGVAFFLSELPKYLPQIAPFFDLPPEPGVPGPAVPPG